MEKDLSIIYNGKLIEVNDSLQQLQELGFNTEKLEKIIKKIEDEVETSVATSYEEFDQAESKLFLPESLYSAYSSAISKLEKIEYTINLEYQAYIKINAKYKSLSNNLQKVDSENIDEIVSKGIVLLYEIRNSSIMDYKIEKNLVENIYSLLYKIIKIELVYRGKSLITEKVISDETDCAYFAKLVKENISDLDIEDKETINRIIVDLAADGLTNQDYLNSSLLNTIIASEDNEMTKLLNKAFLDKIEDYERLNVKYELVERRNTNLSEKNTELKEEKKQNRRRKVRKRIFLNINALIVATGILTSGYVLKDVTKVKEYKTTTKTYNSITEEEKIKETYQEKSDYKLTITEYSPWIEPGYFRDDYSRTIYKYNLSDIGEIYPNLEDYLTNKIKSDISFEEKIETKNEKPKDLGYTENKYIIKETKQDEDVYNTKISLEDFFIINTSVAALIILIDLVIAFGFISKVKYSSLVENYKDSKKRLDDNKTELLEAKEELSVLTSKIHNLREQAMKSYEDLPNPIKEMPKIKQKIKALEDTRNS